MKTINNTMSVGQGVAGRLNRDEMSENSTLIRFFHLWHLLSLDAPTVAALWTWFIPTAIHTHISAFAPLAMFLAVWVLYASDRLLDARRSGSKPSVVDDLEARHRFHDRHRSAFSIAIIATAVPLALILPHVLDRAMHLYLILGVFLTGYFSLVHITDYAYRLPKELVVGFIFAAAVFIPAVATRPELQVGLAPAALLFAALCSLNCLFIYFWEHESSGSNLYRPVHFVTRFALRYLSQIATAVMASGVMLAFLGVLIPRPISLACSASLFLLFQLHRNRRIISATTLRAAADFVLLAPVLFLPFLTCA